MLIDEQLALITSVVRRAPEWVRHELLAKDAPGRQRAEEALAAMISAAPSQDLEERRQVG